MGREYMTLADQLKEQLRLLEGKRSDVEKELLLNIEALPADPGMAGPLVDAESYPRADVDLPLVRQLRQKIIMLRNDQQSLTEQLDKKLQEYFSEVSSKPRRQPDKDKDKAQSSERVQYAEVPTQPSGSAEPIRPFAVVEQVAAGSPAQQGGLAAGDRILQFGGVSSDLATLAKCMADSEGQILGVSVLRRGDTVRLHVTPSRWSGRGLLGANFIPL